MVNAYKEFPHLLSPIKIGGVMFRNRMFGSPVSAAEIEYDGQLSHDAVAYFERKAMGGAAAVAYGEVDVDPAEYQTGRWPREITRMSNYNYARLARDVTRHGAVAAIELCWPGIHQAFYDRGIHAGEPAWGPVDMTYSNGTKILALTEARIQELIGGFANAAVAAKRAGFGMIVLHGAHGFGLQQMMSPTINTRTDKWGGSTENRCRFPIAVIDEIHRLCGNDFPVEIRISGSEIVKEGYGIDEGVRIAEQLDGHADIIHVSVGAIDRFGAETFARTHVSMFHPEGVNVEYAAEIKKHVTKSLVATVGGLTDPYYMEDILASGKADIVYIGRGLVCDPDLPNKIRSGRIEDIRKCMRCLNCFAEGVGHGDLVCAINPEISREKEVYRALPEPVKQRVLVIGGGIAGMQAALVASKYGHDVILCEKGDALGGRILCESAVPFKKNLHEYILLQRARIAKSNIDVRLNTEVTPEYAESEHPDVIIAAIGSEPITPRIPGIDGGNVYQAVDVFNNPSLVKGKAVILGAGFVGTELAVYLKDEFGIESEIVEMLGGISDGGNSTHKNAVADVIERKQIPIHFNTRALEITPEGVKCQGPDGEVFYAAETVIHATGMRPLQEEAVKFNQSAEVLHLIGECRKSANILFATSTAYAAAKYLGRQSIV
ncbi:MAG: NAD(P)/FAD-dependent oxidoreductase [Oscillospiraceae bacterium]|jgi:2,4-dienoyl-CoA reductase-like NADH-dependent reductase (Old Yellow Enzyme family)/thioredoxin reductase|nr:NAD(P)/FAD-dependent oxidoreductase [Oscillospiraceae bacterium]